MSIPPETVKQVALLARLQLDDAAVGSLAGQLGAILDLAGQLDELDTREVVPMSHPLDMPIPERADVVVNGNRREALLANAPDHVQGYFQVPRIIE
ncbi:MAG: Asp-tRNA(Asn)/Glu-tRNA(Gln) amidotransferase subunit GatC [Magnetococcales bacterium]|nr:Asp-tRNA(Asn)/Glu-tRNA(Gln) amidotransferase subunit GatC [Magnetococcales bacterium]